jgi:integrase
VDKAPAGDGGELRSLDERFFRAIPKNRIRDVLLFDLAYRHGLRRSEAARLTLDDLREGKIWVARRKHGLSNAYPLHPRSKRLLAAYLRERASKRRISFPAERRTHRVHLGLGASLHEPPGRVMQHHLDIVLATGSLSSVAGRSILRW